MRQLNVACVQMCSRREAAGNIAAASALIREAAAQGAELIATPEYTTLLDQAHGATFARATDEASDMALAAFRELAAQLGVWLLIGSAPVRADGKRCANRSFLIDPDGAVAARYDKIHVFDAQVGAGNVWRESDDYAPGSAAIVAHTPKAVLGLTICYDVRFPHLYRDLARAGAEIISAPAAFTAVTGAAHWHVLLRARAIECGCFVIAPAQAGRHEDGRDTFGHSLIIDPWGEVLADAGSAPGVILAALDLDKVAEARARIPALQHDRPYRAP